MNTRFDKFRNNKFVSEIADIEKWTVSTRNKVPIDMKTLKFRDRLNAAKYTDSLSLATLDEVNNIIPNAANYTFYLDALEEGFCVLDIEPKCPDDIKTKLLQMPCLYAETSMSGKGVHLVFRCPFDVLDTYPIAKEKVVFKEEHGYYEILLNHYVAFTANQIDAVFGEDDGLFSKLFSEMASNQKQTLKADIEMIKLDSVRTTYTLQIMSALRGQAHSYLKTPADFNNDFSKYEFGFASSLFRKLEKILQYPLIKADHEYTDSEKAWFLYKILFEKLPHRPKHDEQRIGMPWLLYLAFDVIARSKPVEDNEIDGEAIN